MLISCLRLGPGSASAQPVTETVLHHFGAGLSDGASPYSGLMQGADGVLYGTTWGAGAGTAGTVFRMNLDGSGFALLRSFTNTPDGSTTFAGLVQGADGALYGTTYYGGPTNAGTVFKLNPNGTGYTVLCGFTNLSDSANPRGGLIQGRDGALYGTTERGGAYGMGTVFKLMPDGSGYSILHNFTNFPDGGLPFAGVVQGVDGALYGTTSQGGSNAIGTVFSITTNGTSYSVLHSFTYLPDGGSPEAPLLQGANGALYGVTVIGGTNLNGTVFKVNTNGSGYAQLYSFTNSPDGATPYYARLALASDGVLYGTTTWGGKTNGGTVFKLNQDGTGCSVVYHFGGPGDGSQPFAGLVSNGAGTFYGTTLNGGSNGFGTVFRLAFPPSLSIASTGPAAQLTLVGFPGQACQVQATSNFLSWQTLTNLVLTNGSAQVLDHSTLPCRFYRLRLN